MASIFHRVIPNFMIQGGDPAGTGLGGPGYRFEDETKGSPHRFDKPGKLAMANAGPNTNGTQFFITTANTDWLTGKHTIFGEVVEGQDIAEKISKVPRGAQDKPSKPVVIETVTIERVSPQLDVPLTSASQRKKARIQLRAFSLPLTTSLHSRSPRTAPSPRPRSCSAPSSPRPSA